MSNEINITNTINIDENDDFINPFSQVPPIESRILFGKYMSHPRNRILLQEIGNKEVISNEDESKMWTRSEVLRSLTCSFGFRTKPTIIYRDLLNNNYGIIVHQVNCQNVIGSGVAATIKKKWPVVYEKYIKHKVKIAGSIQLIKVNKSEEYPLFVCNLFSQVNYGYAGMFTTYNAVNRAFLKLRKTLKLKKINTSLSLPVYIPYKMGCDCGGGDWEKYLKIIQRRIPGVIICKLPEKK